MQTACDDLVVVVRGGLSLLALFSFEAPVHGVVVGGGGTLDVQFRVRVVRVHSEEVLAASRAITSGLKSEMMKNKLLMIQTTLHDCASGMTLYKFSTLQMFSL